MFKTVTSLFAVSLVVAVLGVTDAHATTFCVPTFHAGCVNDGTNVAQASLETAVQSNATDGVADVVKVDAGTFTDADSLDPLGTDQLTIQGVGANTRLSTSAVTNIYVVNLTNGGNSREITMRDLVIVIPAAIVDNGGAAVQISNDTLQDVDIESRNPGASALVSWLGGGTFDGGRIYSTAGGSFLSSIRTDGNATGTVNIVNAEIDHTLSAAVSSGGPGVVNVRRTHLIAPGQNGITATSGTTNVENTLIESASNTQALYAFANSASNVTINADHVTAISAGGNAAAWSAQAGNVAGNATLNVKNSIQRNYAAAYLRNAMVGAGKGDANLSIGYSNFHVTGSEPNAGDGTLNTATGNIDANPQFVSATDFQLQPGSPSIDKGDPGVGLTTDYLGALRPVDGDANGTAVRDQGAYEYQPPAPADADPADPSDPSDPANPDDPSGPTGNNGDPDTTAPDTLKGKGPKAKLRKKATTFEFSAEAGATFNCALDGKAVASCTSPMTVKGLMKGKHVFTAAAVDAAGNADSSPATWKFKVVKKHKRH